MRSAKDSRREAFFGNDIAFLLVLITFVLALNACSAASDDNLREICESNAETIVNDQFLWTEYKAYIRQKEQIDASTSARRIPSVTLTGGGYTLTRVDLFGYGPQSSRKMRDAAGEVIRNDVTLLRNGRKVATYVNYVSVANGLGAIRVENCLTITPYKYLER